MSQYFVLLVCVAAFVLGGCNTIRNVVGLPSPGDPSITLRSTEARWLLVKNPRFGDVPSEPEYIWVEEHKRPWTFRWGLPRRAAIAPPEVVTRYGPPPGGGRPSPQHRLATAPGVPTARAPIGVTVVAAPAVAPVPNPKRGFVVHADTTRFVIDLTARDGLRPGSLVSVRRDKIPIVHPVTGEVLGELDEEVATGRVIETRDKFSVVEFQSMAPGAQVQVRDRVVPK